MEAPVSFLLDEARRLTQQYGWRSAGLFQRRLRVDARMAQYLQEVLQDEGFLSKDKAD